MCQRYAAKSPCVFGQVLSVHACEETTQGRGKIHQKGLDRIILGAHVEPEYLEFPSTRFPSIRKALIYMGYVVEFIEVVAAAN